MELRGTGLRANLPTDLEPLAELAMDLRWTWSHAGDELWKSIDRGVDLGLWKKIPASALHVPLDVHTGRVARELGLLKRTQDDWKSVVELTEKLREFDPLDPVKYDIALFAIGVDHSNTKRVVRSVPISSAARSK